MRKTLPAIGVLVGGVAAFMIAVAPARAGDGCDHAVVTVVGDPDEEQEACAAVAEVVGYFASAGIVVDLRLTVRFQRIVILEPESASSRSFGQTPVSGYYHATKNEVRMTSAGSDRVDQRRPWRLPWSREIAYSILRHEIAHAAIYQWLGKSHRTLPRAWHEALAYAVQFELMNPALRDKVLAQYPDREALGSTLHINDFVYGADPDAFAVSIYETYRGQGGRDFLKRALRFELEMIDLSELP